MIRIKGVSERNFVSSVKRKLLTNILKVVFLSILDDTIRVTTNDKI